MRVTARVDSMMMIEYYHSVMWAEWVLSLAYTGEIDLWTFDVVYR
jgi:hypothetical protein